MSHRPDNTSLKLQAAEDLKKAAAAYAKLLEDDEVKSKSWRAQAGQAIRQRVESDPDFPPSLNGDIMKIMQGAYMEGGGCCSAPKLTFEGRVQLKAADTTADIAQVFLTVTNSLGRKYSNCIDQLREEVEEARSLLLKGLRSRALEIVRAQKSFEGADAAEKGASLAEYKQRMTAAKTTEGVEKMMAAAGNDYMSSDQAILDRYARGSERQNVKDDIRDEQAVAAEMVGVQSPVIQEARAAAEQAECAKIAEDTKIQELSSNVADRARRYFCLGDAGQQLQHEFFHTLGSGGLQFTGETANDIIECNATVVRLSEYAAVNASCGHREWVEAAKDFHNQQITAATAVKQVLVGYKKLNREMNALAISINAFLGNYKQGATAAAEQMTVNQAQGRTDARQDMAANAQFGKAMAATLNKEDERHTAATSAAEDAKSRTEALEAELRIAKLKAELAAAEAKSA